MTMYQITKEIRITSYYLVEAEDDDIALDYISDGHGEPYTEITSDEEVTDIQELSEEKAREKARVWGGTIHMVSYAE